ncbi:Rhodanese domain protein [Desulforamulus reducens MI-1]|uniref:Rhodanese domain protein n=1 Tax=Desulforamulus reducens (strain ATCC BAA-1160 / DSM 100696 / MI-1) TaxID=349161 RepID=A4J5V0_DESRM|nr:tRNA 2-selenouridine(34) synthase MnmH [Desulforamulus reducens]ABO50453.1 Rhodanese domain protein [Desulforamulus reducens MI-1]
MLKDIFINQALQQNDACFIDLRSEGEFAEGSIPGAINIPLFTNEERAKVGIVYKQVGTEAAKRLGLEIASPKLPALYDDISKLAKDKTVFLYCWRGGMRSKYAASILNTLGINLYRIQGGYKAYRKHIHAYLDQDLIPHKCIVLHGLTGVGKTIVLNNLNRFGIPVLDLESIACHRGSAYGKIGLPESPSQKDFESSIVQTLIRAEDKGMVAVECESRRVGKLIVPTSVFNAMSQGYRVLMYASIEKRVQRIIDEYTKGPDNNIEMLKLSTALLKKSLGNKTVEELNQKIDERKFEEVIPYLLTKYYDPLYKYPDSPNDEYDLSVDCDDLNEATGIIANWVTSLPEYGIPAKIGGDDGGSRGSFKERKKRKGLLV